MKKSILVLILAFFAGITMVWSQAVPGSVPRPLTGCTPDPWNPIAGVPYDYSADVNPANGNAYWYATTSTTFMTGGVISAVQELVGGTYVESANNYMTTAAVPPGPPARTTTTITWSSDGIAAATVPPTDPPELFVVVNYDAPATGCANNMKVYPIRPINAFTVDLRNIEDATQVPLAYDASDEQCVPGVQSAAWIANPVPDGSIDYDFGIDSLYYEVVAANFTESYTPSFQLAGLDADQTADIAWGYDIAGPWSHVVVTGAVDGNWTDDEDVLTNETNTSNGVSIYVLLVIHNNDNEGTALNAVTFAVDAVNSAGQDDVDTNCNVNAAFADAAVQNVNPRPTVAPVTGTFLPVAP